MLLLTMKTALTILFQVLMICCLEAQPPEFDNRCVKSSRSLKAIKKIFPFNKTEKIKTVSFKPKNNPYREGMQMFEIPKVNNRIDTLQLFESKTLSIEQEQVLLDILMNYNFKPKAAISTTRATCEYSPRNAVLFCDKTGNIVAYIEICFECHIYEISPQKEFASNLRIGEFCTEKWTMMKVFFEESGIKFGIIEQ
jgi:hypothetical protein